MSLFSDPSFDHYWAMWNERDLDLVRGHMQRAVTDDFIFCDPVNFHVGHDALERNVREFRAEQPLADFVLGSGVDSHHDRRRYEWHLTRRGRVLVRGYDVATIADTGLIERIDGFFGPLPSLEQARGEGERRRMTVTVTREFHATANAVWDTIVDIARMGEWSPETSSCAWDDGVRTAALGATFTGHNQHADKTWSTQATVIECRAPARFEFEVRLLSPGREIFGDDPYSRWSYTIEPTEGGCIVTESTTDLRSPEMIAATAAWLTEVPDRAAYNRESMQITLDRLAAAVEPR